MYLMCRPELEQLRDAALFSASFGKDGHKFVQWQSFMRKTKPINVAGSFEDFIGAVKPAHQTGSF
jgi:hypothetical protein